MIIPILLSTSIVPMSIANSTSSLIWIHTISISFVNAPKCMHIVPLPNSGNGVPPACSNIFPFAGLLSLDSQRCLIFLNILLKTIFLDSKPCLSFLQDAVTNSCNYRHFVLDNCALVVICKLNFRLLLCVHILHMFYSL